MPTVKILSWNIDKFGKDKVENAELLKLIASVAVDNRVDIVGIMEVVSNQGQPLANKLKTWLNNLDGTVTEELLDRNPNDIEQPRGEWQGTHSARDGREQYVYLWNEQSAALKADANSAKLIGKFPKGDPRPRGAFYLQFQLAGSAELPLFLFHAPNPLDTWKLPAIHHLAHESSVRTPATGVIMGDFNVTLAEHTKDNVPLRDTTGEPVSQHATGLQGRERAVTTVFQPLLDLGYQFWPKIYWEPASFTSLRKIPPENSTDSLDSRFQPYDKFFVKGVDVAEDSVQVVDIIAMLVRNPRLLETWIEVYNSSKAEGPLLRAKLELAKTDMKIRTLQQKLKSLEDPISLPGKLDVSRGRDIRLARSRLLIEQVGRSKDLERVARREKIAPIPDPPEMATAHKLYERTISDHLPIVIELTY